MQENRCSITPIPMTRKPITNTREATKAVNLMHTGQKARSPYSMLIPTSHNELSPILEITMIADTHYACD